jgi:hypothetical protein
MRGPSSFAVQQLMSSALQRAVLSTRELWPSSFAAAIDVVRSTAPSTEYNRVVAVIGLVQQFMSSALWRVVLSTAERRPSSVAAAIDVVRSTTREPSSVAMQQCNYVRVCKFCKRVLL